MSALTHWLKKELIEVLLAVLGELAFDTLFEYKSLLIAKELILNAISEPRFRAIQFWLIILLLIFVTSKELIGAIEPVRIRQLFVGR